MYTANQLPSTWQPHETIKHLVPDTHDWRSFAPLPENENRYIVCINGGGVFDIYDSRFLTPTIRDGRAIYRISLGPNAKAIRLRYNRIIASLVFPASQQPKSQAHHLRRTVEGDNWANLRWQSGKQNRAVEVERKTKTRRPKPTDRRHKLTSFQLALLVEQYDDLKRRHRDPNLPRFARLFEVSLRQIQRIVAGDTRANEVAAIREQIRIRDAVTKHRAALAELPPYSTRRHRHENALRALNQPPHAPSAAAGNPLFDADELE